MALAAPVEGRGEAAVHFGTGRHRGREGHQGGAEAERIGVALGHAGSGRGDADRLDRAGEPGLVLRPEGAGDGVVGIGEAVGERRRGTMAGVGVAVEAGGDVARAGPAQPHERRERYDKRQGKQDDAADAQGARREYPDAKPREREEQRTATASAQTSGGQARSTSSTRPASAESAASLPPRPAPGDSSPFDFVVSSPKSPQTLKDRKETLCNHGGSVSSAINSS